VPITAATKGEQLIIVPVGWGSASRIFGPASMMTTEESKYGPSRLLAFKLGARTHFPFPHPQIPAVPRPPQQSAAKGVIDAGKTLYESHLCAGCHSPRLDGSGAWTVNGAIPDLRYMPSDAHKDWYAIVLAGTHEKQGMLAFGRPLSYPEIAPLTVKGADAIHAYIIDESWKAYRAQRNEQAERNAN
jgi:mono/diheme cytochrome c family protein